MEDTYRYYVGKYIEKKSNLTKPIMAFLDKNNVFQNISSLNVYINYYKVIEVQNNILFRSNYENIKYEKDERYILVLKNEELVYKLQDFIKRAEEGKIIEVSTKDLLDIVEQDLCWHERINDFSITDIQYVFNELMDYRKCFNKRFINIEDVDRIFLSALLNMNAISVNDFVDCYILYRNVIDLLGSIAIKNYKTDLIDLLCKVFKYSEGVLLSNVIQNDIFKEFERFMWTCYVLKFFNKLSSDSIEAVIGSDYKKVKFLEKNYNQFVDYVKVIEKKDKKLFIDMKDKAETWVKEAGIDLYAALEDHIEFLRENINSYICILDSIRKILKDFNVEGLKKVYKYDMDALKEIKLILDQTPYTTDNTKRIKKYFDDFLKLILAIDELEKVSINSVSMDSYLIWTEFYRDKLSNLQYMLSKIRYMDNENILEKKRYISLDKRISSILNKYRKSFAEFVVGNYSNWISTEYGLSRPILNNDIGNLIDLKADKIFIIVFDGMRYDAWNNIVQKYFNESLLIRDTNLKSSFSMLPSITSVSRECIYKNIMNQNKSDVTFTTKSEAFNKQGEVEEKLLDDKKINIIIYNMFDKDGHKASEDLYLFYDKQEKVFESSIKKLIKSIPSEASIVITSDHGLMRIDEHINVKDIVGVTTVKSRYLETDGEVLTDDGLRYENYIFSYNNEGYFMGGGEKDLYSHGGCSLEEVIVPFIYSKPISNVTMPVYAISKTIDSKGEVIVLHDGKGLRLPFKINDKEQAFMCSLYKLSNLNTKDIEKIFIKQFGSAGMIDGMIRRFIRKLQTEDIDIIDTTTAGEFVVYKLKLENLLGGGLIE